MLEQDATLQAMLRELRPTAEDPEGGDRFKRRLRTGMRMERAGQQRSVAGWLRATAHLGRDHAHGEGDTTQRRRAKQLQLVPMLHPQGRFRTGWNVLVAILITYSSIVVPMQVPRRGQCGQCWRCWQCWQ